jgi:quercetin dioxygenase-like cupin family protein
MNTISLANRRRGNEFLSNPNGLGNRILICAPVVMSAAIAFTLAGCEPGPGVANTTPPPDTVIVPAAEVDWQPAPPALEEGAEIAVLDGDPAEEGPFTIRLRMPDGYIIAPHSHPHFERVTVIEGTLLLGLSEELDLETAEALPAGSYFYLPPELPHFAIARGQTVIQVSANGPFAAEYVDPADDPRH